MYKIFIVEDDEMIAAGLKRHLENWGYAVECAQDLGNVMPEFVRAAPQLVLMDIKLPFYNGNSCLKNSIVMILLKRQLIVQTLILQT